MVDSKPGKLAGKAPVKAVPAQPLAAQAKAVPAKAPVVAAPVTPAAKPAVRAYVRKAPVAIKAAAAKAPPPPSKVEPAAAAITPPTMQPAKDKPVVAAPNAAVAPSAAPPLAAVPAPVAVAATVAAPVPDKIADPAPSAVPEMAKEVAAPVAKIADIVAKTIETIMKPTSTTIQKGFTAMTELKTPSFVPTPEHFQAMFTEMSTRAKTAVESSTKLAEEMGEFAKGNVEAVMTSGRVAAKGAEALGQDAATYSKKSLESATTAFKSFVAAKSPTELFKLQSDYARSSFDAAVAESSKLSETVMKLFGEITQPISTRVAMAAEKIKTPAF